MEIQIVIERSGKLSIFIKEGTFEEGKIKIEKLLKDLQLEGIEFSVIGDVERHTHDQVRVNQKEKERN